MLVSALSTVNLFFRGSVVGNMVLSVFILLDRVGVHAEDEAGRAPDLKERLCRR